MAKLQYKIETWMEMSFSEDDTEKIKKRLIDGASISDIYDEFNIYCSEQMIETDHEMTIEENDNQSTIELRNCNDVIIFQNGNSN